VGRFDEQNWGISVSAVRPRAERPGEGRRGRRGGRRRGFEHGEQADKRGEGRDRCGGHGGAVQVDQRVRHRDAPAAFDEARPSHGSAAAAPSEVTGTTEGAALATCCVVALDVVLAWTVSPDLPAKVPLS
jgi:hypothetical protein